MVEVFRKGNRRIVTVSGGSWLDRWRRREAAARVGCLNKLLCIFVCCRKPTLGSQFFCPEMVLGRMEIVID